MRSLPVFVLTRLLSVAVVTVIVTILVWLTFHVLRPESWAYDTRPVLTQLADYLRRVFLHWDFGESWTTGGGPVSKTINAGLPADISLLAGGMVVGGLAGATGGAYCAARPGSVLTRALQTLSGFFIIAPVYWVGLMVILVFHEDFGPIPIPGFTTNIYEHIQDDPASWLRSLIVPWFVLGAPLAALTMRMTRAAMADVRHEDFLRTAEAKGLSEAAVLRRHALPAASSPVLTVVGVNTATLLTNVVLVEHAFSVPGVFRLTTDAMNDGNFPLLQGMTVVAAAMVVSVNLLVDVLHAAIDPRVRVGRYRRI